MTPELEELYKIQNCLARFSDLTMQKNDDLNVIMFNVGLTIETVINLMIARREFESMHNNVVFIPKHFWERKA